jgi:hypothetical protein
MPTTLPPPAHDQLPPHDDAAEAGALGCVLLNPDCLSEVCRKLTLPHFYSEAHGIIFAAFKAMHREGVAVDEITLQSWLRSAGHLEGIGGLAYLSKIQERTPSAANLPAYIETLQEKFQCRRIVQTCAEVTARIMGDNGRVDVSALKLAAQSELAEVFAGGTGDLPEMVDAAAFLAAQISQPAELVSGMIQAGSKVAFGGCSKGKKTWCLLDLGVSVATGARWLGHETTQGKVLFVNFEIQPHAWQKRIAAVARAKGVELRAGQVRLWNLRGFAADFRTLIPKILQSCRGQGFALIVLDPIYKLYGGTDENAAGDVAELLNAIERLATETGAAVAFGAHFAKGNASAKEAIDRISGSGVFARDPDSLLIFTKHEEEDAFTVEPILRNFAPVEPFAVRWQFPLMVRANDLDPSRLKQVGGRKQEHSPNDLLGLLPREGLSNAEWLTAAKDEGMSRATFFRLRRELKKDLKVLESAINGKWQPISPR